MRCIKLTCGLNERGLIKWKQLNRVRISATYQRINNIYGCGTSKHSETILFLHREIHHRAHRGQLKPCTMMMRQHLFGSHKNASTRKLISTCSSAIEKVSLTIFACFLSYFFDFLAKPQFFWGRWSLVGL